MSVWSEPCQRARPVTCKVRTTEVEWVRSIRDQAVEKNIKFFYKQAVIDGKIVSTPALDGKVWTEVPRDYP